MGRQGKITQVFKRGAEGHAGSGALIINAPFATYALVCALLLAPFAHADESSALSTSTLSTRMETTQEAQGSRKAAVAWKIGMGGVSFANEKDQAQVAGFGVGAKMRYRLLPSLVARLEAGAALQTGYAQSRFGENTPKSGFGLKEAVLQYKPFSMLALQAGAISQAHLDAPLLVSSSNSFPGALERFTLGTDDLQAEITAQQTVPTSTTLATKTVDSEPMPTFMSESLTLKARLFDRLLLKAVGAHYSFKSLPSSVAYESEAHGNTILEVGPESSKFKFEFEGWLAGGEAKLRVLRGLWWSVGAMMIQNTKAADSYKNGQMTSTGFGIALPREIDFEPKGFVFFNESDVSPAFYSSSELGHSNRQGWGASADLNFKKEKFKIGADYVNADVINPSVNQSRQQFIRLQFETKYEML